VSQLSPLLSGAFTHTNQGVTLSPSLSLAHIDLDSKVWADTPLPASRIYGILGHNPFLRSSYVCLIYICSESVPSHESQMDNSGGIIRPLIMDCQPSLFFEVPLQAAPKSSRIPAARHPPTTSS